MSYLSRPISKLFSKIQISIPILIFLFWKVVQAEPTLAPTDIPSWYQTPAGQSLIVSSCVLLFIKGIDALLKYKRDKKRDNQIPDATEIALEEMTNQQWLEVVNRRDKLHSQQLEFMQQQINAVDIGKFEYRERTTAALNEINRLQNEVLMCREHCRAGNTEMNPFKIRTYEEIMAGVDEKVDAYVVAKSKPNVTASN